jgi:hypothetical protein
MRKHQQRGVQLILVLYLASLLPLSRAGILMNLNFLPTTAGCRTCTEFAYPNMFLPDKEETDGRVDRDDRSLAGEEENGKIWNKKYV